MRDREIIMAGFTGWANWDCASGKKVAWGRIPRLSDHFGADTLIVCPEVKVIFGHRTDGREDVSLIRDDLTEGSNVLTETLSKADARQLWKRLRAEYGEMSEAEFAQRELAELYAS
jgi:hypothetical protein